MKHTHRVFFAGCLSLAVHAACVPPRGGWDVDALWRAEPELAAFEGSRLGDMTPFPAFGAALELGVEPDHVELVACRFRDERVVRVRGGGVDWPRAWADRAVAAMDRAVAGVDLALASPRPDDATRVEPPAIEILMVSEVEDEGPTGLGDTLVECDVTPTAESGAMRGEIVAAEIRMRIAQLDIAGRMREATAEEWTGALMHELGHALGFAGHAAWGRTSLVRDELLLREIGRRALAGESEADATLASLYALPPGQRLGQRTLRPESVEWLRALEGLRRMREANGKGPVAIWSSVGDREARLVWRYADDRPLVVRFPDWRRELRSGQAITLVPDGSTRRALALARE